MKESKETPLALFSKSDLIYQIEFMENMSDVFLTPIFISIINSLTELKGIKQKQTEKFKNNG